ncbi:hypothetical protein ACH492_27045 [Streptomyces sp. NPDC019443]|uniref:hypothetical protein n=1 Tax=Streptomyces sp. NPDC019443 TaxID=3365061 RepID=UPI0037BA2475
MTYPPQQGAKARTSTLIRTRSTKVGYKVVEVHPDTTDRNLCKGKSDLGHFEQTSGGRRSSGKRFVLCLDEIKK